MTKPVELGKVETTLEFPERILVYVMPWDTGLAPNFNGAAASLSLCKPNIRRSAKLGRDWIVGITPRGDNRLTHVFVPDERLSFDQYYRDPRFQDKKPQYIADPGDNIYRVDRKTGQFRLRRYFNDIHKITADPIKFDASQSKFRIDPGFVDADLQSPYTLLARKFWYFGAEAPAIPEQFEQTRILQGTKRNFRKVEDPAAIELFVDWVSALAPPGVHSRPRQETELMEFRANLSAEDEASIQAKLEHWSAMHQGAICDAAQAL